MNRRPLGGRGRKDRGRGPPPRHPTSGTFRDRTVGTPHKVREPGVPPVGLPSPPLPLVGTCHFSADFLASLPHTRSGTRPVVEAHGQSPRSPPSPPRSRHINSAPRVWEDDVTEPERTSARRPTTRQEAQERRPRTANQCGSQVSQ